MSGNLLNTPHTLVLGIHAGRTIFFSGSQGHLYSRKQSGV